MIGGGRKERGVEVKSKVGETKERMWGIKRRDIERRDLGGLRATKWDEGEDEVERKNGEEKEEKHLRRKSCLFLFFFFR